ncbi:MAG: GNAT family N-acetyltransferase, partial [Candidatus Latescibacteria bacterium]|nr:GNAT family N-acetyltransferase [bacterium]MBD3423752.1 GNAT family N-acetyltransferase [Candidatus Latescibacterota bacterium]
MKIRNFQSSNLQRCRKLWVEMAGRYREIYDDLSIGGIHPGLEFDEHLEKVGAEMTWVFESDDILVVTSDMRGHGLGRKLIGHLARKAEEMEVLCLGVNPVGRNREAVEFFCDSGFITLGHIQMFRWLESSSEV